MNISEKYTVTYLSPSLHFIKNIGKFLKFPKFPKIKFYENFWLYGMNNA